MATRTGHACVLAGWILLAICAVGALAGDVGHTEVHPTLQTPLESGKSLELHERIPEPQPTSPSAVQPPPARGQAEACDADLSKDAAWYSSEEVVDQSLFKSSDLVIPGTDQSQFDPPDPAEEEAALRSAIAQQATAAGGPALPAGHVNLAGADSGSCPFAAMLSGKDPHQPQQQEKKGNHPIQGFHLPILFLGGRTQGAAELAAFKVAEGDIISGRYRVGSRLPESESSEAMVANDMSNGNKVHMRIFKGSVDESLEEIKTMKYVGLKDPNDKHGIVQLVDCFYFQGRIFLVTELLAEDVASVLSRAPPGPSTMAAVQKVALQALQALAFMHSVDLVHGSIRPQSLRQQGPGSPLRITGLGSVSFLEDAAPYSKQPRPYRSPEVLLGLPYGQKADIWSLGCVLAGLPGGLELFQADSDVEQLAKIEGTVGPIPGRLVNEGQHSHRFYTRSRQLYRAVPAQGEGVPGQADRLELLKPRKSHIEARAPGGDAAFYDFVLRLLTVDPAQRATAAEALTHPWLQHKYDGAV